MMMWMNRSHARSFHLLSSLMVGLRVTAPTSGQRVRCGECGIARSSVMPVL